MRQSPYVNPERVTQAIASETRVRTTPRAVEDALHRDDPNFDAGDPFSLPEPHSPAAVPARAALSQRLGIGDASVPG